MPKTVVFARSRQTASQLDDIIMSVCGEEAVYSDGSDADVLFDGCCYDLAVMITPLADESGIDLACKLAQECRMRTAFILIVPQESTEQTKSRISALNMYAVSKSAGKTTLNAVIDAALQAQKTIDRLIGENSGLEKKIDDIKLIDRAKCVLIEYLRITEAQAHKHIQKQAMDQRVSPTVIARDILRTYEM